MTASLDVPLLAAVVRASGCGPSLAPGRDLCAGNAEMNIRFVFVDGASPPATIRAFQAFIAAAAGPYQVSWPREIRCRTKVQLSIGTSFQSDANKDLGPGRDESASYHATSACRRWLMLPRSMNRICLCRLAGKCHGPRIHWIAAKCRISHRQQLSSVVPKAVHLSARWRGIEQNSLAALEDKARSDRRRSADWIQRITSNLTENQPRRRDTQTVCRTFRRIRVAALKILKGKSGGLKLLRLLTDRTRGDRASDEERDHEPRWNLSGVLSMHLAGTVPLGSFHHDAAGSLPAPGHCCDEPCTRADRSASPPIRRSWAIRSIHSNKTAQVVG